MAYSQLNYAAEGQLDPLPGIKFNQLFIILYIHLLHPAINFSRCKGSSKVSGRKSGSFISIKSSNSTREYYELVS